MEGSKMTLRTCWTFLTYDLVSTSCIRAFFPASPKMVNGFKSIFSVSLNNSKTKPKQKANI